MKIILGGGLIGLIARDILGSDWIIIPIGRSRYYSFDPPLADNYVVRDDLIDEYMREYTIVPCLYRIGYSYGGQILFNTTIPLSPYLDKLYGGNVPPHASSYWGNRIDLWGYGNCIDMYMRLQEKYKDEILNNNNIYGVPSKISDHTITANKQFEYDEIISTVPLPALLGWMNVSWPELKAKDVYCYHVRTDCLDFEGATHLFVADPEIEFFKASMINKQNYIFYAQKKIEQPGQYFMGFMKRFELIAETSVPESICCGHIPAISDIDDADITCVGSSAVWDDCLDVGSCIKRILKL